MIGMKSTAAMLDEIKSGTAAEAVMAMRYTTHPFGPTFIPTLDERLIAARPHPAGATLQRGDLLEVVGPTGSGKSTLITFLLLTTLLPPTFILSSPSSSLATMISTGGRGAHAALLHPLSHRSLIPRLGEGMKAHLISCITSQADTIRLTPGVHRVIDEVILGSLARLRVVKLKARYRSWCMGLRSILSPPRGHLERLARLEGTRGENAQREREEVDHGLELVVCDGFGDGFWPERWNDEERAASGKKKRSGPAGATGYSAGTGEGGGTIRGAEDAGMRDVMDVIGRLRNEMGAVVVLSIQALWSNSGTPYFSPHLPYPYPTPWSGSNSTNANPSPAATAAATNPTFWPLNIQLTLTGRVRSLQLPSDLTLIEAMHARGGYAMTNVASLGHEAGAGGWRKRETQKFEGYVRVNTGDLPVSTGTKNQAAGGPGHTGSVGRNAGRWEWRIGEDGLEAWVGD